MDETIEVSEKWINEKNRNQYEFSKKYIKKENLGVHKDQRDYVLF